MIGGDWGSGGGGSRWFRCHAWMVPVSPGVVVVVSDITPQGL